MNKIFLVFCLVYFFLFSFSICAETKPVPVRYSYFGNFSALELVPEEAQNAPVVIYLYDEFYDRFGRGRSTQQGYDPFSFLRTFEEWGFISIMPNKPARKLNGIKAAIRYAQKHPQADPGSIFIVGCSEASFLSLFTGPLLNQTHGLILINPKSIHDTGYLSFPGFRRVVSQIKVPVLHLVSTEIKKVDIHTGRTIYKGLKDFGISVDYQEYPVNHRWFWTPKKTFMGRIKTFIDEKLGVEDVIEKEKKSIYSTTETTS